MPSVRHNGDGNKNEGNGKSKGVRPKGGCYESHSKPLHFGLDEQFFGALGGFYHGFY